MQNKPPDNNRHLCKRAFVFRLSFDESALSTDDRRDQCIAHSSLVLLTSPTIVMALNIEPSDVSFAAAGGNAKHEVVNQTDSRHAFKGESLSFSHNFMMTIIIVKCSDNQYYRVRPVYGFVNAKGRATIEIFRLAGPAKDDKIVVQWVSEIV